jgi:eukaryotic-like serine/threonine-protein kinase
MMNRPSWLGYTIGGRYKIEELLGQGGMSSVYKATDPNLRRTVAVKLIHPHLSSNADFVRRFEEEAASVAQLRHSNIIQVYDFNHDDDTYYMVLEYVPGETLQQRLMDLRETEDTLPLQSVVQIGASLADAIDYAHRRGMIHRDIKPANVMLDPHGQAILMDFGIAKMIGGEQHTATGAVVGTALYMSPEQVTGQRPTTQSDIYSLGVTLFEMISGRPPFDGDSAMSVMMAHVNQPVPDLNDIHPGTPGDLKMIVEKALAKDPTDRFASASDVAIALRSADLSGRSSSAPTAEMKRVSRPAPEATMIEQPPSSPPPPRQAERTAWEPAPSPAPQSGGGGGYVPPQQRPQPVKRSGAPLALIGGGLGVIALLLICLGGGAFLVLPMLNQGTQVAAGPTPTDAQGPIAVTDETTEPTEAAAIATTEAPPTETPTITFTPSATDPSGLYARINSIVIENGVYVVDYETFEYNEQLPGMHVHFYFNTVSEAQAGSPGGGPWFLYGGPRPFKGYSVGERPQGATQMCARVANHDHSIIPGSGNCVDLPE